MTKIEKEEENVMAGVPNWLVPIIQLGIKLLIALLEHVVGIDIDGDGKVGK